MGDAGGARVRTEELIAASGSTGEARFQLYICHNFSCTNLDEMEEFSRRSLKWVSEHVTQVRTGRDLLECDSLREKKHEEIIGYLNRTSAP